MESILLLNGGAKSILLNCFDESRGRLCSLEFDQLPFYPKRSFVVDNVPAGTVRGQHAHQSCFQLLICLSGKISVTLKHLEQTVTITLEPNSTGLLISPLVYSEQLYLTDDSVLLVFTDTHYDPNSYINRSPS